MGDEECEELVNLELSKIVARELATSQEQLYKMKRTEQQVFLTKILHGILEKVRSFGLEINDKKYLFLSSKVMEKVYSLHEDDAKSREEEAKNKEE